MKGLLVEDVKQVADAPLLASPKGTSTLTNLLWFGVHLAAVYVLVHFFSAWLSGRFYAWILPIVDPGNRTSTFQFGFTHLFEFTFLPAFVAGFANSRFNRRAAFYIWIVPAIILGYKLLTFRTSVFQDHFRLAFHYYFGRDFLVGEFHDFQELFTVVAGNPDAIRGMDQFYFSGPFYAALGYSLAALVAGRVQLSALAKAFSRPKMEAAENEEAEPSSSENTADTTYLAAPDGTPRRE